MQDFSSCFSLLRLLWLLQSSVFPYKLWSVRNIINILILYIKWINRFAIQWKGKKRQKFFSYLGPRGGAKADTNQTSHFPGARVWIPGPHPYIHVCELHFLFDLELQELYCSEYHIGYQCSSSSKLLQLCPTLGNPIDSSPPGSPIPGIL